ncbi:MAG TPA: hypothetical protein VLP43_04680 [Solirubrobacteraceae bacterium]|nr:hypothetical protein [Solirubrobacteraceae bacterium]
MRCPSCADTPASGWCRPQCQDDPLAIRTQGRYKGQIAIVSPYSTDFNSALITGVIKKLNRASSGWPSRTGWRVHALLAEAVLSAIRLPGDAVQVRRGA